MSTLCSRRLAVSAFLACCACRPSSPQSPSPVPAPAPTPPRLGGVGEAAPVLDASSPPPKTTPSAAPRLSGRWEGVYYAQANRAGAGVRFVVRLVDEDGRLFGTITEPNTFGDPKAVELAATLRGYVDKHRRVVFDKRYDGRGGVTHQVRYEGVLDVRGSRIEGTWTLPGGGRGSFYMGRARREGGLASSSASGSGRTPASGARSQASTSATSAV